MDQVTQQNAALVEQAAAALGAMREQAAKLEQAVGIFQVGAALAVVRRVTPSSDTRKPIAASSNPMQVKRLASAGATSSGDWDEF